MITPSYPTLGLLRTEPAQQRPDLVAAPVAPALGELPVYVAEIDPMLSDTAAFCAAYQVPLAVSANCVVLSGRRGGVERFAAAMVLGSTRADVNGVIRRYLDVRRISFAPMDQAVALTGMEYGGITPIGLPADWPILVDTAVAAAGLVVIGAGVRGAKLLLDGSVLAALPGAVLLEAMAAPAG